MNSFIETLNQWSLELPGLAWQMFWQSSLLIAALFVFDFAMRRKVRAAIRYALWLVILIKLIVPPTLALPTGLAWWLHSSPPPQRLVAAGNVVVTYGRDSISIPPPSAAPIVTMPAPHLSAASLMLAGSALVSLALLGWLLVRWLQVSRDIRRAKEASEPLGQLLVEAGRLAGLRSPVRLRLTQRKMSPAVCGLFRPVILLPERLAGNLPGSQLRAVLVHELTHVKRGDVWVNCLQTLVQIVYWWHPLVWLANARLRHVREEAVDDAVMLTLRDEADCYAPTLLEVAKLAFSRPLASLGLVGILESRSALRQRIERLIDFQAPRRAGLSFVSLLGIAAFTAVAVPMGEAPQALPDNAKTVVPLAPVVAVTNLPVRVMAAANTNELSPFNPLARTNLVHTSAPRQAILDKLKQIRLDRVSYDGLPLPEVIRHLQEEIKQRAPDKKGVNFLLNQSQTPQPAGAFAPATGLPVTLPETDIKAVRITLQPALTNVCLADVLDAIVKCADKPIKYSILDYGITFSPKGNESPPLSSRRFKLDVNTFLQTIQQSGISTNGNRPTMTIVNFFKTNGVNLDPPKTLFFNDSEGSLWVRASTEDLDVIEAAVEVLNRAPQQINIDVKFLEVPKEIARQFLFGLTSTTNEIRNATSILTAPQTKVLLNQLKSAKGVVEILNGAITTLSGRQAQIQAVEMKTIVQLNRQTGLLATNTAVPFGPVLDVIPYVGADGYTIQMTVTPSTTELLDYDRSQPALPRVRIRQMTTSAIVWDGQTLVLGCMGQNEVVSGNGATSTKHVPEDPQRNLLVLVTPTVIDPAGNRIHQEDRPDILPVIKK